MCGGGKKLQNFSSLTVVYLVLEAKFLKVQVVTGVSYLTFKSDESFHLPLKIRVSTLDSIYCSTARLGLKFVTIVLLSSLIIMCNVPYIPCRHRVIVLGKVFSKGNFIYLPKSKSFCNAD